MNLGVFDKWMMTRLLPLCWLSPQIIGVTELNLSKVFVLVPFDTFKLNYLLNYYLSALCTNRWSARLHSGSC